MGGLLPATAGNTRSYRTARGRAGAPRGKRRACRLQPCRTVGAASRGLQAIVCGLCWRRTYPGRRAATLSVAHPPGRIVGSYRTSPELSHATVQP